MTPQLGDISEPGLGDGSSTKSSTPWVLHRAGRNARCRWKGGKRKPLASCDAFGGKDTQDLLAPVKGQTRAAGAASGHSQSPKDGGMGEMSQEEGGEWLAGGSHSKMSMEQGALGTVWV